VMVSTYDMVPKGSFYLCVKEGGVLVNLYTGLLTVLGDSFVANGEARTYVRGGRDVYYVFNPGDINDEEIRKMIFPDGINLRDLSS